jgi:arylsulfatase
MRPIIRARSVDRWHAGDKTFKNHLDGYNFQPYFEGKSAEGPRRDFFYFSDNADLMAVRYNAWKLNFKTIVGEFLATFKEYPPSQASGTLSVEKALTMLQDGSLKTEPVSRGRRRG